MDEWTPVFVLPNVELEEAIEGGPAVLAPAHDPRVIVLCQEYASLSTFLNRFTDAFGESCAPTVLLRRLDAPATFRTIDALSSFRNLIALSVIPYGRAFALNDWSGEEIFFGESFAFYPWMIEEPYEVLKCKTPAVTELQDVQLFRGQSLPGLPISSLERSYIDRPLFQELLMRWRRRYESAEPSRSDIALFRSLNMAYHASLMPAAGDTTFYDVGRIVALWVSAFEILAHPGEDGRVNRNKVLELIKQMVWQNPDCESPIIDPSGKTERREPLAFWICNALYECRNSFIHGNPVSADSLRLPVSDRVLFSYAAPLYRIVLTVFLQLKFNRSLPSMKDTKEISLYLTEKREFFDFQIAFEDALLTAYQSKKKDRE
ncbi:hypothetical protein [Stigmatella aurantiaca]|nr:hypothetical protein [Stigmatella aurantiaca]